MRLQSSKYVCANASNTAIRLIQLPPFLFAIPMNSPNLKICSNKIHNIVEIHSQICHNTIKDCVSKSRTYN